MCLGLLAVDSSLFIQSVCLFLGTLSAPSFVVCLLWHTFFVCQWCKGSLLVDFRDIFSLSELQRQDHRKKRTRRAWIRESKKMDTRKKEIRRNIKGKIWRQVYFVKSSQDYNNDGTLSPRVMMINEGEGKEMPLSSIKFTLRKFLRLNDHRSCFLWFPYGFNRPSIFHSKAQSLSLEDEGHEGILSLIFLLLSYPVFFFFFIFSLLLLPWYEMHACNFSRGKSLTWCWKRRQNNSQNISKGFGIREK